MIKRGRSVIAVELLISSKDSIEALRIRSDIEKEFGYDQLTLWDQLKDGGYIK